MRADILKLKYDLKPHPEGGWFSEVYTSEDEAMGRPLAGSIYFLLDAGEISHFHRIDCDELWYFHEGCGLILTVIDGSALKRLALGNDTGQGQRAMVLIPKGCIFAAENKDPKGYTFISCATAPKFCYDGFELLGKEDILAAYPEATEDILRLAFEEA